MHSSVTALEMEPGEGSLMEEDGDGRLLGGFLGGT